MYTCSIIEFFAKVLQCFLDEDASPCPIGRTEETLNKPEKRRQYQQSRRDLEQRLVITFPQGKLMSDLLVDIGKQYRIRCVTAERGVTYGAILIALRNF